MKALDKRLRLYGRSNTLKPKESKIKDTIVSARENFYEGAEKARVSYFDFLYDQTCYIHKRWWGLQFALLLFTGIVLHGADSWVIQRVLGIAASLFVIMAMPELWKNRSSDSMEIEGAAYFSIRQIYAARMLLFGVVDGLLLGVFTAVMSLTARVMIGEILIQFFLPMIVTCCICFRTLCSRYIASEYTACFLSLLWGAIWIQFVLNDRIYQAISVPAWGGICGIAVLYLTYAVKRTLQECGNGLERKG